VDTSTSFFAGTVPSSSNSSSARCTASSGVNTPAPLSEHARAFPAATISSRSSWANVNAVSAP